MMVNLSFVGAENGLVVLDKAAGDHQDPFRGARLMECMWVIAVFDLKKNPSD